MMRRPQSLRHLATVTSLLTAAFLLQCDRDKPTQPERAGQVSVEVAVPAPANGTLPVSAARKLPKPRLVHRFYGVTSRPT